MFHFTEKQRTRQEKQLAQGPLWGRAGIPENRNVFW